MWYEHFVVEWFSNKHFHVPKIIWNKYFRWSSIGSLRVVLCFDRCNVYDWLHFIRLNRTEICSFFMCVQVQASDVGSLTVDKNRIKPSSREPRRRVTSAAAEDRSVTVDSNKLCWFGGEDTVGELFAVATGFCFDCFDFCALILHRWTWKNLFPVGIPYVHQTYLHCSYRIYGTYCAVHRLTTLYQIYLRSFEHDSTCTMYTPVYLKIVRHDTYNSCGNSR